jgi:hypothetical protein
LAAVQAVLVLVGAVQVALVVADLQVPADRRANPRIESLSKYWEGPATAPSTFFARPKFVLGRD